MRPSVLRLWIGAGLLTSSVLCGCRQMDHAALPEPGNGLVIETVTVPASRSMPGSQFRNRQPEIITRTTIEPPVHEVKLPVGDVASADRFAAGPILPISTQGEMTRDVTHAHHVVTDSPGTHASDYRWLVGVLERGPESGTWSLRYAGSQEGDRYGGSLTLVAPSPITGYRTGQLLRVQGHVIEEPLQTAYQVEGIETLLKP